ncbi:chromate resistance protein ChrB domain-containing protein [Streptomyces galilaeus]|uniref:chromate resistance protein ChrB domain-containing protein n=1 Tax=Streptomyces galilaeus TaxID=33899 RepID=UPI0038F6083B
MKWATRVGIHIDRAACAWLIRRFVGPDAQFVFVTDPAEVPSDATPFDMRGVELGHHHGDLQLRNHPAPLRPHHRSRPRPHRRDHPRGGPRRRTLRRP